MTATIRWMHPHWVTWPLFQCQSFGVVRLEVEQSAVRWTGLGLISTALAGAVSSDRPSRGVALYSSTASAMSHPFLAAITLIVL